MTGEQAVEVGRPLTRWFELAGCRRASTEEFFDHAVTGGRPGREAYRVAQAYCRPCPVLHSCRREARTRGEVGVWGGQLRAGTGERARVYDLLPTASTPARRRASAG